MPTLGMLSFSIEKTASMQDVAERILSSHLHLSASKIHKNEIAAKIKPADQYPGYVAAFDLYYGEGLLGEILISKDGDRSKIDFTPNPKYPATT